MKVKKNLWSIVGCATRVASFFEVAPISLVEGGHKTEVTFLWKFFSMINDVFEHPLKPSHIWWNTMMYVDDKEYLPVVIEHFIELFQATP